MEINVPFLYYKGYKASIETSDGLKTKLETTKNSENGFVLVSGDKALSGTITVKYSLTIVQIVSYIISGLSIISLGWYMIYIRRK